MRFILRRIALGLGLMLIVLGWGCTHYADARQEAVATGKSEPLTLWQGESTKVKSYLSDGSFVANKTLYISGMIGMGLGVVVIVVAFPRGSWQPSSGP